MIGALIGGLASAGASIWNANRNLSFQKRAAKQGIQWKVADAKKAGVHPIYALGAPTFNPSPVSIDGSGFSQAGQALDRAVESGKTHSQQQAGFNVAMSKLQLQNMELQNAMLASRIARIRQAGSPPPAPGDDFHIPGQPGSGVASGVPGLFLDRPLRRTRTAAGHSEGAAIPDRGFSQNPDGSYNVIPSGDVKQRIEDQFVPEVLFALRNYFWPSISKSARHPPFPAPPHKEWVFRAPDNWQLVPRGSRSIVLPRRGYKGGRNWNRR